MSQSQQNRHSIFDIAPKLLHHQGLSEMEKLQFLCNDPRTLHFRSKLHDNGLESALVSHWQELPALSHGPLATVSGALQTLSRHRRRVMSNVSAHVRFNSLCDEVEITDFFGLLGFVVSAHAYPLMTTEKLGGEDVGPIVGLLLLYCALCNKFGPTLINKDGPDVIQATWIRNPGGDRFSLMDGCIALGCNLHEYNKNLRDTLLLAKIEGLNSQYKIPSGLSPMQQWAKDNKVDTIGAEWGACAETVPFVGLAQVMCSRWSDGTSQYQMGVLAITRDVFDGFEVLDEDEPYEKSSEWFEWLRADNFARAKEMCQNCSTLTYNIIGADVVDFARQCKGVSPSKGNSKLGSPKLNEDGQLHAKFRGPKFRTLPDPDSVQLEFTGEIQGSSQYTYSAQVDSKTRHLFNVTTTLESAEGGSKQKMIIPMEAE
ncbi:hypothetical protein DFH06DRAFT_1485302 [Mycena polygramma]|nr:hypothetical protein DFH06DRAFT_1485302 [Mycena polygramma]